MVNKNALTKAVASLVIYRHRDGRNITQNHSLAFIVFITQNIFLAASRVLSNLSLLIRVKCPVGEGKRVWPLPAENIVLST